MGTAPRTEPCNSAAADRHCLPEELQPIPLGTVSAATQAIRLAWLSVMGSPSGSVMQSPQLLL